MLVVLDTNWYTTCDGKTIGIVKTQDTITKEIKRRIGIGFGKDYQEDVDWIVKTGDKFIMEVIK